MADMNSQTGILIDAVTADGAGSAFTMPRGSAYRVFQANIAGTGAVSATVTVEGSIDGVIWSTIESIALTGTTTDEGYAASVEPWPQVRGRVASISGTGATVSLKVAI